MTPGPGPAGPKTGMAAVVVNYNAAGHLTGCLRSIAESGISEAVVVDNNSTDDSRAIVDTEDAVWLPAGSNLGYGRAANLGAQSPVAKSAEYLLICNPDVEIFPGAVEKLVEVLENDPSVGLVGPAITNPDGTLYPSARTFPDMVDAIGHGLLGLVAPRNRFTRRYRLLDWDHRELAKVDWVSGACFVVRHTAWDSVGGFDPDYFMYMEDVDLCWRIGRAGWDVAYEPAAKVLHVQGVSADRHPYRMLAAHHRSLWRFAWRTTEGSRRVALPAVGVGLLARLAVAAALHRVGGPTASRTPPASPPTGGAAPRPLP
ncbi:MAG TPA: glycosyltransferase family 2 protein [Acidimicrobiales bacterium]